MNGISTSLLWQSVIAGVGVTLVAFAGGASTELGPWYDNLRKPSWQPPPWVFPVVWTTIFVLMAVSGVRAWRASPEGTGNTILSAFVINGLLNMLWSLLFFKMHRPDFSLIEVVALWLSIVAMIAVTWRVDTIAPLLLVPYLIWVSIAAYLNLTIVRLNGPFGAG